MTMTANGSEMIYKDEVYRIVGAAMTISNELGCGFLEAVYQEARAIELDLCKIPFEVQKKITIPYKHAVLKKEYFSDFVSMR